MEENIAKFGEKLKQLVAHGKKNKSILELQEINDFFSDMELDAEHMEKVYEYLEANHIDVLRVSGDGDGIEELDDVDDSDIVLTDEDDVDMGENRLVCAGWNQYRGSGPHVSERDWKGTASFSR